MTPSDQPTPEAPKDNVAELSEIAIAVQTSVVAPSSGKRQAFKDIRRQLSDTDLTSPGVQKLLLDELDQAETQCELLNAYVERFHDADKRAAVLEEKLRGNTAFDILFTTGVGLGCAIMGLAPLFWNQKPEGALALTVGGLLVVGSTAARMFKQ